MNDPLFKTAVRNITSKDKRYDEEAYQFINEAVMYTVKKLGKNHASSKEQRHISGRELLEGIAEFAIKEYASLAGFVLREWGLDSSMAIGNVVFNMVENKLLSATENDSISDFKCNFDFKEVFDKPFYRENAPQKSNSQNFRIA